MAKKEKKTGGALKPNQIKILEALSHGKEMSRADLSEKTGVQKGFSKLLGASTKKPRPDSLEGQGFVKSAQYEEQASIMYTITAAGKKALTDAKAEVKKAPKESKEAKAPKAKKAADKKAPAKKATPKKKEAAAAE